MKGSGLVTTSGDYLEQTVLLLFIFTLDGITADFRMDIERDSLN